MSTIRKKSIAVILVSIMIAGILAGCGHSADIGKDKATEIALEDAKLTQEDVTRLRVSKERDDGENMYHVEFTSGNTEYEYEISVSSGEIRSSDYDESHDSDLSNQNGQQEQKDTQGSGGDGQTDKEQTDKEQTNKEQVSGTDVQITLEEASRLALKRVPGATEQDLKIELDYDDGRQTYEGDIIYKQKEYEFEIDANTGEFLDWEEERR